MAAVKYWIWLTTRKGMDSAGALTVLDHFITPERAYYADPEELELIPLTPAARKGLLDKGMEQVDAILGDCQRLNLRIMTFQDADYPERLRQLADPPMVLYIRGKVFAFDEEAAIGVVGARDPSDYGKIWAERFAMEITSGGGLVVSGMAEGVDSFAVRGALKAGGPVVSVLAGGVDVPFPPQHKYLYEDVAAAGALISEYPPGTQHRGYHFPRRNRILSGLCLGVLAVECRPFGGTMSTVNHALEQDRDVFAVPGALGAPMSEGTNRLIQQGAKLVTCGRDVLEEYRDRYPFKLGGAVPMDPDTVEERLTPEEERSRETKPAPKAREVKPEEPQRERIPRESQKDRFTDDELAILAALGKTERSADELVELTQIPTRRILSALTMLQVQGTVEERPGRRFFSLVDLEE